VQRRSTKFFPFLSLAKRWQPSLSCIEGEGILSEETAGEGRSEPHNQRYIIQQHKGEQTNRRTNEQQPFYIFVEEKLDTGTLVGGEGFWERVWGFFPTVISLYFCIFESAEGSGLSCFRPSLLPSQSDALPLSDIRVADIKIAAASPERSSLGTACSLFLWLALDTFLSWNVGPNGDGEAFFQFSHHHHRHHCCCC